MDYINLLSFIVVLIFAGTTLQLAVIKNNIDRRWNDKYGHIAGNYCFLCVSFWINFIIVGVCALAGVEMSIFSAFFLVFSVPAGIALLIRSYE